MSLASEELEKLAAKSASEAIQYDRQGLKGMAITKYQRAVEILLKLTSMYPDANQNKVYMEYVELYQRRAKELKGYREAIETTPSGESGTKFENLVLREKPNITWDDIAGLDDAKRAIIESIIYPYKRPDLFPLGWPRGILLFGPPGCGKTLLAAAIAKEINAAFYCIDAASIMSKWLGESEKNVARLFETARLVSENGQPAIIFMDEIDSLVGIRSEEVGGEVRTRNQFMKEMDSVVDKTKKLHVYLIGATNKPWALDQPFIRRFQKRIYIPLPDYNARLQMFKMFTTELSIGQDVEYNGLASSTDNYSGSDIRDIVQGVHISVVREFFEKENSKDLQAKPRSMTMNDFYTILNDRKPSVSQETIKYYDVWFNKFKAL
jgi:SpoVK/Ycf46/Vps4 family AAA+-type ATPase